MSEQGPQLSETDVLKLEAMLGASLPAAYRRFLLANNGGVPDLDVVDVPGFAESPTDVQEFLGIGLEEESSRIDWNLEVLGARLGELLVPVACDSGGNIFRVAADFDEFLQRLRADSD